MITKIRSKVFTKKGGYMKRIHLYMITALVVISIRFYAHAQTNQEESSFVQGQKLDWQILFEKNYDDPITDVILKEIDATLDEAKKIGWKEEIFLENSQKQDKTKIYYPKVIVTSPGEDLAYPFNPEGEMRAKEIRFYEKNGNLLKIVNAGHRLLKSENGRHLVVANMFGNGYDENGHQVNYQGGGVVYNWNGSVIGKILSGRILQVSDSGYILVDYGDFERKWVVYDSEGNEMGSLIAYEYQEGASNGSRMSTNGNFIVTVILIDKDKTIYILWDKTGNILWKKVFPFHVTGSMPLSHSIIENVGIIGKTKSSIIMINWDGELFWSLKKPTGGSYRTKFSDDHKKVFLISSNGYVFCIDALSGAIMWQHKIHWADMKITENYPNDKYYYDRFILLENYDVIVARTFVGPSSGIVLIDMHSGDLLLEATEYQKVTGLFSKNNFLFIIEKHKLTGNLLSEGGQ